MLAFIRNNIGIILFAILFFGMVFGGIYYVEHSLESQERVVN